MICGLFYLVAGIKVWRSARERIEQMSRGGNSSLYPQTNLRENRVKTSTGGWRDHINHHGKAEVGNTVVELSTKERFQLQK